MKQLFSRVMLVLIATLLCTPVNVHAAKTHYFGSKYRGASTHETAQIHYEGKVYFRPHYATRTHIGYVKYSRKSKTITSNWTSYVPYPKGFPKSKKMEAKVSCWDSLSWNAPKTKFNYNFK